jgi:hypothetical protein
VGIRLTIVDDNPHLAWDGRTYPVNATFQRFAAGLLDLPGSPVASITTVVPVREADAPPASLPLDPRIRVVRSAPFDGIAGYLRHLPSLLRANRPTQSHAIDGADLRQRIGWSKLPSLAFDVRVGRGEVVFEGRGAGHGAGMCQWGAAGLAREGKGYREILAHYYPGAELRRMY